MQVLHLVKHFQDGGLKRGRINDPELDSRLALELFGDEREALRGAGPNLLAAGLAVFGDRFAEEWGSDGLHAGARALAREAGAQAHERRLKDVGERRVIVPQLRRAFAGTLRSRS